MTRAPALLGLATALTLGCSGARLRPREVAVVAAAVALTACAGSSSTSTSASSGSTSLSANPPLSASPPSSAASVSSTAPPAVQPLSLALPPGTPAPCGTLTCRFFPTPEDAFAAVIAEQKPLVLALGESHAQKGFEHVPSTTSRFTNAFLPQLENKASSLVLELWVADPSCNKEKVAAVQKQQGEVTKNQAAGNQNEFVKLGEASRAKGIVPFLLKPTCAEYDQVKNAGADAVLEMLSLITRHMNQKIVAMVDETAKKAPGKMVVAYGGALHNDVVPKPGREGWSFAKDVEAKVPGRYVELDLVVPEFIQETDSWKGLPWYGSYDRAAFAERTVLIEVAPRSYVLVFPRTPPPAAPPTSP